MDIGAFYTGRKILLLEISLLYILKMFLFLTVIPTYII